MFSLCSDIRIEPQNATPFSFRAVNEVTVKRSIYEVAATATVKVPVTAVLRQKDGTRTTTDTAKAIHVGDRITIRLGYDDRMNVEFIGYVVRLNLKTPLEIECEDEFYTTRNRNVILSGTQTLAAILKKCGLDVAFCETLTVSNFAVPNRPVSAVLGKLSTDYGLCIFFDVNGKCYAARPESIIGGRVKYVLRRNVINEDQLQYNRAEDVKLKIKAVCFKRDGTKIEATIGSDDGTDRTLYFYDVTSVAELKTLASAELKRYSFNGYRGSITTFLEPYAAPAMCAELTDPQYPQRDGTYYVEGTQVNFGRSGGRRTVEIGVKI